MRVLLSILFCILVASVCTAQVVNPTVETDPYFNAASGQYYRVDGLVSGNGIGMTNVNARLLGGYTAEELAGLKLTYYVYGSVAGCFTNPSSKSAMLTPPTGYPVWTTTVANVTNNLFLGYACVKCEEAPASLRATKVNVRLTLERDGNTHDRVLRAILRVYESNSTTLVTEFIGTTVNVPTTKDYVDFSIPVTGETLISVSNRQIVVLFQTVSGWSSDTLKVYSQDGELTYIELGGSGAGVYTPKTLFDTVTASNASIRTDSMEPMGFVSTNDAFLTFTNSTRTFAITPTGSTFGYYYRGEKRSSGAQAVTLPNASTSLYFIYFDGSTALVCTNSAWSFSNAAQVATVYYHGSDAVMNEERHGITMDWRTHELFHESIGARYISGLAPTFANKAFTNTAGGIHDEDIEVSIPVSSNCLVWYRTNNVFITTNQNRAIYYTTNTAGTICYDNGSGLVAVPANEYVAYWMFASTVISNPAIQFITGQRTDANLTSARANSQYSSLSFGNLNYREWTPIARVLMRNVAGTVTYVEWLDLRSYSALPSGASVPTPTAQQVLTSTAAFTNTGAYLSSADVDVQTALNSLARIQTNEPFCITLQYVGVTTNDTNNIAWYGPMQRPGVITNITRACSVGVGVGSLYIATNGTPLTRPDYLAYSNMYFVGGTASNTVVTVPFNQNIFLGYVITNGTVTGTTAAVSGYEIK